MKNVSFFRLLRDIVFGRTQSSVAHKKHAARPSSISEPMKPNGGLVGALGLTAWWSECLSLADRQMIHEVYRPMGGGKIDEGDEDLPIGSRHTYSALEFLTGMAPWFIKDEHRSVGYKILVEAERYLPSARDAWEVQSFYHAKSDLYYRGWDEEGSPEQVITACRAMIAQAPALASQFRRESKGAPLLANIGYDRLAVILERDHAFQETIDLCQNAKQQGWCGNWDDRIERCKLRMAKAQAKARAKTAP